MTEPEKKQETLAEQGSRESFERWVSQTWMTECTFDHERNCYIEFPVHMAWKGWNARLTWEH